METVEHFIEEFIGRYGVSFTPAFQNDSLENVFSKIKNCPLREKKPLAIYMHRDRNDNFCSVVLCSDCVVTYLNENFVVWGWDVTSSSQMYRITKPLMEYVGYSFAIKMRHLRNDQLPVMLIIGYTRSGAEVLSFIHDISNVNDVMSCLMRSKEVFDDNLTNELQMLEEQECKKTGSWCIPWKPVTDTTLEPSKEEKIKQELETQLQIKRKESFKKELVEAVSNGDWDTVHAISEQGGDLTVLVEASHRGNVTWCLLTLAAFCGHSHLLVPLLDAGLSVEGLTYGSIDTTTWTPLMVAARQGHDRMIKELLSHDANPLAKDMDGAVALHHAGFCGQLACIEVLSSCTPNTITDNKGRTPIHAACLRGHLPVIEFLKDSGWKLDTVDKEGNTPLHHSAWFGSLEVVKYLYKHKADSKFNAYKKNCYKFTPFDYSVRQGHHDIEKWFLKIRSRHSIPLCQTQHLLKSLKENAEDMFMTVSSWLSTDHIERMDNLPFVNDCHWMDKNGMTILHLAVTERYCSPQCTAMLLDGLIHPHVVTLDGFTPLDLARQEFKKSGWNRQKRIIKILEEHQCPKEDGSPEELYEKLLTVISEGDNVEAVSRLLCAGAPMELVGNFPNSALQLAITNDRPRIVNLLLASGASLTPRTEGFNLLQQAWYSANTTTKVLCAIINAFSRQLKKERDRLPRHTKGLRKDLAQLIASVDGDAPWKACWQSENTIRSVAKLTSFMVIAVRANCPLIASFLQWAGAGAFIHTPQKTTPLHAALEEGNVSIIETLIRDLGGSLYIPDAQYRFPKNLSIMTPVLLKKLEKQMYEREQRHLETLKEHKKDESEKQMVQVVLNLQKVLFDKHINNSTDAICSAEGSFNDGDQETIAYALLVASRSGLQQLLYLLLIVARFPADLVVDVTSSTTCLHEAAAHGKSGCVALLLSILKNAAMVNEIHVTKAQVYARQSQLKSKRLNRYSPLQPDKYSQTALHLAAMFGHKHTLELLTENMKEDPPCRAGTTAQKIHENFTSYLRRYMRYDDNKRKEMTPLDHHEADTLLDKLLCTVDLNKLPKDAKRANVDLNMQEAEQVKKAVLRAVGIILARVVAIDDIYKGRLELVGSGRDGSKLFAPDEFDINIVIPAADRVNVSVHQELDESVRYQGHALNIIVETSDPHLQGNRLMGDLFEAVKEALAVSVLDDKRLSVVPPSLNRTQVGVALALAWQGIEYPLLLVGVDLVPVLEVPWHEVIIKPDALTPPDTSSMHISNTADGSWRCSFALLEAEVLRQLSPEERHIHLSCKMLLYFLKAERWMPREIKSFCTWWTGRSFNVPVPTGFCLKSSFFRLLAYKRNTGIQWLEEDTTWWMAFVFRSMCQQIENKTQELSPSKVFAYFGGDCEGPKIGHGAPIITQYLEKGGSKKRINVHSLVRYFKCVMASLWKFFELWSSLPYF